MTARFVAVGVPGHVRAELDRSLVAVRERWPDHAWTDPAGWHVTLAFLGELADDRVPGVAGAVASGLAEGSGPGGLTGSERGPVRLSLATADRFGDRALVVRITDDPAGRLAAMGERIQVALDAASLPVHRRKVQPHVTIARARRGRPVGGEVVTAVGAAMPTVSAWSVGAVGVWASHPGVGPARYAVDAEVAVPS